MNPTFTLKRIQAVDLEQKVNHDEIGITLHSAFGIADMWSIVYHFKNYLENVYGRKFKYVERGSGGSDIYTTDDLNQKSQFMEILAFSIDHNWKKITIRQSQDYYDPEVLVAYSKYLGEQSNQHSD